MYYRFSVKRTDNKPNSSFHYETFFAAQRQPTRRQLLKHFSGSTFEDAVDMIPRIIEILSDPDCDFPTIKNRIGVGSSFDEKQGKYAIILERLDITPLAESDDLPMSRK